MKFEQCKPYTNAAGMQYVRSDVIVADDEAPCRVCGEPTRCIEIGTEARFCSDECVNVYYELIFKHVKDMLRYSDVANFLKKVRNIPSWDRTPAISDKELDKLIELSEPAETTTHGAWISEPGMEEHGLRTFRCSVCGETDFVESPYCPHCFAKMDMKDDWHEA